MNCFYINKSYNILSIIFSQSQYGGGYGGQQGGGGYGGGGYGGGGY